MRIALLAALAAITSFAPAPAASPQPVPMTADEKAAVIKALNRGSLIYAYDQAAWHGTDDMIEQLKANGTYDGVMPNLGGWVVEGPIAAPVITFFDKAQPRPNILYSARMTANGRKVAAATLAERSGPHPVSDTQLTLISALRRARAAIAESGAQRCSDKASNTVVLAGDGAEAPTLVYFLTPQITSNSFPIGGHYRVDVGPETTSPKMRAFSKSCLTIGTDVRSGKKPEALVVTHLLDPVPTEIHVFTMFAAGTPLYVATTSNSYLWVVDAPGGQARIKLLDTTRNSKK